MFRLVPSRDDDSGVELVKNPDLGYRDVHVVRFAQGALAVAASHIGVFFDREAADMHVRYIREQCEIYDVGVHPMVMRPDGSLVETALTAEEYKNEKENE